MPKYRFTYTREGHRCEYLHGEGSIVVEGPDLETCREHMLDLIDAGTFDPNELVSDMDHNSYADEELEDARLNDTRSMSAGSSVYADYIVPPVEEDEDDEDDDEDDAEVLATPPPPNLSDLRVSGINRFWQQPSPGWWRPQYANSYVFDLANPEDKAFLQSRGVDEVLLLNGSVVQIQTAVEWMDRVGREELPT